MLKEDPKNVAIIELSAPQARSHLADLIDLLIDAVDSGASVSFLHPLSKDAARVFWKRVIDAVSAGQVVLLGAVESGRLVGTVQLRLDTPQNQQHRIEVNKLLVLSSSRRKGVGSALMRQLEQSSLKRGRRLIVLDTLAGSDAEKLYQSLGYSRAGVVPLYAQLKDGVFGDTAVYYKQL